jgi:hypothetical protein
MKADLKNVPDSILRFEVERRAIEEQAGSLRDRINARIDTLQSEIDALQDLLGRVPTDPTSEEPEDVAAAPRESRA